MYLKQILLLLLSFGFSTLCNSQNKDKQFEIGISGNYLFTGEFNSIYDIMLGIEGQYYFSKTNSFNHFINAGYNFDIGTAGANIYVFDIGIGSQYHIGSVFKKGLYLEGSLGALFWNERLSTQLLNNTIDSSFSEFGFIARLGFTYEISTQLNLKLHATQLNSQATAGSFGISYSF